MSVLAFMSGVPLWVISGHTDKPRAMSALPRITDVGHRIQVSIWLSVYGYTLLDLSASALQPGAWDLRPRCRQFGFVFRHGGITCQRATRANLPQGFD